ncbi:DctP family TRAP transporter solute-binding subunit [Deferribacter thermophilus]|uniref:DctP family TRAP transporter solute-binding subunit n=1 Tax=Deferribacter thermophilus TaxID=53573 RepID=UPI003C243771
MRTFFLSVLFVIFFSLNLYPEVFRLSHVVSDDSPKGLAVKYFKEQVEKHTKGVVKIEIFSNGVLFDDREALGALKKGIIQFAIPSFSKIADDVKEFQLFDIPYLFKSIDHIHRTYVGFVGNYLKKRALEKGYVVLAFWDNGFKVITTRDKPIYRPVDLKGLKIRTQGSYIINKSLSLTGAIPITKPFNVVVDYLKSGVIDGQQNTFSNIYTQGFYKYQRYLTVTKNGFLGYAFITSRKFWNSLSDEYKEIIKDAVESTTIYEYKLAEEKNIDNFMRMKTFSNLNILVLDDLLLKEWEEYYKGYYPYFYDVVNENLINEVLKLE